MANQPTDSDASNQFAPGVGTSEQGSKSILDLQPNWIVDGYGIRGPQRPVAQERVRPHDAVIGSEGGHKTPEAGGGGGPCPPETPPITGTYVWGTVDGECQWIETTSCPPE